MTINNGQLTDATEALGMIGDVLEPLTAVMLSQLPSDTIDPRNLRGRNFMADDFTTDNILSQTNAVYSLIENAYLIPGPSIVDDGDMTTIDEFETGSIDLGIWTIISGSPTESGGELHLPSGARIRTNANILTKNSLVRIKFPSGGNVVILPYNGTTTAPAFIVSANNTVINIWVVEEKGVDIVYILDGAGNLERRAFASGSQDEPYSLQLDYSGGATIDVSWIRKYDLTGNVTGNIVTNTQTHSSTITNVITTIRATGNYDNLVLTQSADNGANFEASTIKNFHSFSNTGTQLQNKFALASADTAIVIWNHGNLVNLQNTG